MPRPKKQEEEVKNIMDEVVTETLTEREKMEQMSLKSLGDYMRYNKEVRRLNKMHGQAKYTIKQCPEELHPKERVVFSRNDQPTNPLDVFISNEMIEFKKKLIPGQTYDLPRCVVEHLASKGTPIWRWVEKADGSRETHKTALEPRFSLRTLYTD